MEPILLSGSHVTFHACAGGGRTATYVYRLDKIMISRVLLVDKASQQLTYIYIRLFKNTSGQVATAYIRTKKAHNINTGSNGKLKNKRREMDCRLRVW